MYKCHKQYHHVYIDLGEDLIYYHDTVDAGQLGMDLIDFIYADLDTVKKHPEQIMKLHPFLQTGFELNEDEADDSENLYIDLVRIQTTFKELLYTVAAKSDEMSEEIVHYLARHPFYSSGTIVNQRIENKNHWLIDYIIMSFEDCLMCELMELMRRHMLIKACKNCGKLFIARRSNIEYCTRSASFGERTCSEAGYANTFAKNLQNDELLQAYTRAYKAHYARMTKPRKKARNMTREEFESWYREAKQGLKLARRGELDEEVYKAWLKE